jgi:hypothetical protein
MIWNYWLLNTLANALNFLCSLLTHNLVRSAQHFVHPLELLPPQLNLPLNRKPLLFFDLLQLMRFDNDLSVELVNFCINDFVSNGFDRPHLHFGRVDIQ